jgi:hypothetical protein
MMFHERQHAECQNRDATDQDANKCLLQASTRNRARTAEKSYPEPRGSAVSAAQDRQSNIKEEKQGGKKSSFISCLT